MREIYAAPRYPGEPINCPECGKPFSDARINHHRAVAHNIGVANV